MLPLPKTKSHNQRNTSLAVNNRTTHRKYRRGQNKASGPRRTASIHFLVTSKRFAQVDSSWNVMAHGDLREGKWRGNWRMEWVASTLHTTSEHGVSSITIADARTSAASSRLNWPPTPSYLNGLVHFPERRNLHSAGVPSRFNWPLLQAKCLWLIICGAVAQKFVAP